MPTSVPGPGSPTAHVSLQHQFLFVRAASQNGFSLLEMLIVLVIIGIATATVGVSMFSGGEAHALRTDALRLSQLFSVAQAEARKEGNPVMWRYNAEGYDFMPLPGNQFLPAGLAWHADQASRSAFTGGSSLRPRSWDSENAVEVRVDPPVATVFDTEWISGPSSVELSDGHNTVRIVRLGNGKYQVLP